VASDPAPDGHYFRSPAGPGERRVVPVRLAGQELEVVTADGVFSRHGLDLGTRVLLREAPDPPAEGDLLDLGCGWGPLALRMAILSPRARVWAVDVNERALALTAANAERLRLPAIRPSRPEDVPEGVRFGAIWSNPPIRVGKGELHALLQRWLPRLAEGASAHLVVQRHLGADSLQAWLAEEFAGAAEVTRAGSAKGFRVLKVDRVS
jgi:16S rRNA (guanine1207-N2)-methyltransferase